MLVEQKRKIVPPVYLLLTLAAMAGFHYQLPIAQFGFEPYTTYAGIVTIALGVSITVAAAGAFWRAGTPVVPFEKSTALVTGGLFRYTRNPMYLGMILLLLGAGLIFGSVGSLLPIPLFAWIIVSNFIRGEENFLQELFGEEYRAYKSKVRRWL